MSFSRSTSSSSMSTTVSTTYHATPHSPHSARTLTMTPPAHHHAHATPSAPSGSPASMIASLPSLAHSLSSFPNMTSVTNDMVHYGTLSRSKGVSEAKLNTALQTTRQRKDGHQYPGMIVPVAMTSPLGNLSNSPSFDDDAGIMMASRKKHKYGSSKDATQA